MLIRMTCRNKRLGSAATHYEGRLYCEPPREYRERRIYAATGENSRILRGSILIIGRHQIEAINKWRSLITRSEVCRKRPAH